MAELGRLSPSTLSRDEQLEEINTYLQGFGTDVVSLMFMTAHQRKFVFELGLAEANRLRLEKREQQRREAEELERQRREERVRMVRQRQEARRQAREEQHVQEQAAQQAAILPMQQQQQLVVPHQRLESALVRADHADDLVKRGMHRNGVMIVRSSWIDGCENMPIDMSEPSANKLKKTIRLLDPKLHPLDKRATSILKLARTNPIALARAMEKTMENRRMTTQKFHTMPRRSRVRIVKSEDAKLDKFQARMAWRMRKFATMVREGPEALRAELASDSRRFGLSYPEIQSLVCSI